MCYFMPRAIYIIIHIFTLYIILCYECLMMRMIRDIVHLTVQEKKPL